jgi:protein O-mannosyl-transferase
MPRPRRHTAAPKSSRFPWRSALLVVAGLSVYANSLSSPFIFDDEVSIVRNAAIRAPGQVLAQERDTPLAGRPIVGLTFALNYAVAELDVRSYRITNIAIHLVCALLLFALVSETLLLPHLRGRWSGVAPNLAFSVAVLWVVHPLATDAVTYITQRTESLMALFYLLTLYASLRASLSKRPAPWHLLAVAACACGMASKESMATAPIMVAVFDRIFLFDSWREALRSRWRLYSGLALTWLILVYLIAPGPRAHSAGFFSGADTWVYLLNQSRIIPRYLRLVFWPSDLVINYGPPVEYSLTDVLPYAALVVVLMVATITAIRWRPPVGFLGAWFFITLAPSSSFVPISTEVAAERRMYLPLMAVLAGIVIFIYWLGAKQKMPRNVAILLLITSAASLGTLTIARNREHQSWLTLAQKTLEHWPTDAAHGGIGSELARLRRDTEALPHLQIAARTDARARYNLGVTLHNLRRYDEAIRELDVLVDRYPGREEAPWARRTMGSAYTQMSRWPEAIAQLRLTLSMTPHDAEAQRILVDAYHRYGVEFARAQKYEEAITQFRQGLALDQNNASLRYNLATALFDKGEMKASFAEAQRAIALDPANADGYNLLGKLLAMQGHFEEALVNLEAAVKLRPDDASLRDDLARVQKFLAQ